MTEAFSRPKISRIRLAWAGWIPDSGPYQEEAFQPAVLERPYHGSKRNLARNRLQSLKGWNVAQDLQISSNGY